MLGRGGLDQHGHIGGAGCRHLRAAHSPGPRTVRLLMQQAVQQQPAVPFAASASCRCNHPGHDGGCRGVDVRRCEFRPAASGAERDSRSNPDVMWRTGPTYLGVRAGGGLAKSWSPRLRINGKPCNLGLGRRGSAGRYPIVTLAEARDKALESARAVGQGSEPRDRSRVPVFKQAATGTRSAGSGRRRRSASGSRGARPTWTASEQSGPW